MGQLGPQDCKLLLHIRVLDIQIGAAPPQRLRKRPCPVGGEYHKGKCFCLNGADLRDAHLHFGQQLQQKRLEFLVCLVDLIDQQHHRLFGTDGFQQRPFQQIVIAEQRLCQLVTVPAAHIHLNGQQLLLVVPLIERLAFIQSLVALQTHQLPIQTGCHHLGDLGLAHAGSALDQQRSSQLQRHKQHRCQRVIIDVMRLIHFLL